MLEPYNIGIYRGTNYKANVQWMDDLTNAYVDLTNAVVVLQARYYLKGPIILESSTDNGLVTLNNSTHTITINITPAQTNIISYNPAPLLYDVLLRIADGTVYKIMQGSITVLPTVANIPENISIT